MKKLGFGLMRLPKKGPFTDIEQTKKMVDMSIWKIGKNHFIRTMDESKFAFELGKKQKQIWNIHSKTEN